MAFKSLSTILLSSLLLASPALTQNTTSSSLGRLEPPDGKHYMAFWLDMDHLHGDDLPVKANARTGLNIPVFQFGQSIPVKDTLLGNRMANQTNEALLAQTGTNAAIYITLYPNDGLEAVSDAEINLLVKQLKGYDDKGIATWLRFAPEMNGNWNPYSQQPSLYRATWIRLAKALRAGAPNVALVFSPNMGYTVVGPVPPRNSTDFNLFDTNNDGVLNNRDDPYLPYWPGDEWVDWVGLSVYHFGFSAPNFDNTPAKPGEFEAYINGNSMSVDFYTAYASGRNKPMMISESAQAYNPGGPSEGGRTELELKQNFWRQYYTNATFLDTYPKIKFMCQFEIAKIETAAGNAPLMRDFRITNNTAIWSAFTADLAPVKDRYIWASASSAPVASGGSNGTQSGSNPAGSGGGTGNVPPDSKASGTVRNVVGWGVAAIGVLGAVLSGSV
ncbi:hypothetical protein HDV00_001076 [Rhizophlyctis rosea]|nr:hypothetical protein HDV00_001076 [Rhizophlyctis rosea]